MNTECSRGNGWAKERKKERKKSIIYVIGKLNGKMKKRRSRWIMWTQADSVKGTNMNLVEWGRGLEQTRGWSTRVKLVKLPMRFDGSIGQSMHMVNRSIGDLLTLLYRPMDPVI